MSAGQEYVRDKDGIRLNFGGINTMLPPDRMPDSKYPYAQNIRRYLGDAITGRSIEGAALFSFAIAAVNTMRRLNDSTPKGPAAGFIIVSSAGADLYANATPVSTLLSGKRCSMLSFRPNTSVQPWMYVADANVMLKVRSDGTTFKQGIAEPQQPPTATLATIPQYAVVNDFETLADWKSFNMSGGALFVRSPAQSPSKIFFDFPANVGPATVVWPGATTANTSLLRNGNLSDLVFVAAVQAAPPNTTIGVITYDNFIGPGFCSITTSTVVSVQANQVYNLGGTEVLPILSVQVIGGATVLRFNTTLVHGPGESMNGVASYRMDFPLGGSVTDTLSENVSGWSTSGTATQAGIFTFVPAYQQLAKTRATTPADVVHLLMNLSTVSGVTQITVRFNVDPGIQDFSTNAYEWDITSGITPANTYIDFNIPVSGLTRLGTGGPSSNPALTMATGIFGVQITVTYGINAPAVLFANLVIVGQDGPTVIGGQLPDTYFYTYRGSSSGAESNPSPPMREGVTPTAQGVYLVATPSPDPQADFIDFWRQGGSIANPVFIGSVANSNTPLLDDFEDLVVANNQQLAFDNFEPFPSIDVLQSGFVNVNGFTVTWVSGSQFNIRWLPGTVLTINGVPYNLYNRPQSATSLTILQSGGIQSNVPFLIAEPKLAAQPMPAEWGVTDNLNFAFACGDPLRPGTLYFTKNANLDSAPDTNQIEVTSPTEPLMNGYIINGVAQVFSTERAFWAYPNFFNALATVTGTLGSQFTMVESIATRGLFAKKGLATDGGGNGFFIGKDGIYISPGGTGSESITDADLFNLFPHENSTQQDVTLAGFTVFAPDFTKPDAMELAFASGYLYFDYQDKNGNPRTLVYDVAAKGWVSDVYQFAATSHVIEEGNTEGVLVGCSDGSIRRLGTTGIETTTATVLLPAFNAGDARAEKRWGDIYVEAQVPAAQTVTVTPYSNKFLSVVPGTSPTSLASVGAKRSPYIVDFNAGQGFESVDIEAVLSWNLVAGTILYLWQPSLVPEPESIQSRATDWTDGGSVGTKFVQGVIVEADTFGALKSFQAQIGDDLTIYSPAEAPAIFNGQSIRPFSFNPPFVAHTMRLMSTDGIPWRIWGMQWIFQPYPSLVSSWQTEMNSHGMMGWFHLREVNIPAIATQAMILTLTFDKWPTIVLTVPSTNGLFVKQKVTLPPNKSKLVGYSLTSQAKFRLFQSDVEVKIKQWGADGPYQLLKPFGGPSNTGAPI